MKQGGVQCEVMQCERGTAREGREAQSRSIIQWKDSRDIEPSISHHSPHAQEPSRIKEGDTGFPSKGG